MVPSQLKISKYFKLYPNSVFRFGIGWYFLGIFHTNTEGKLGKAFGILHLVETPYFSSKGGFCPLFDVWGKNIFPLNLLNGVPAKFHKIVFSNTDWIYRPASASNLPIPAKLPVYRWSTTLELFQFGIDCLILYVAMVAKVVTAATFALQQIHSLFWTKYPSLE